MAAYDHRYIITRFIYKSTNNSPPDVFLVSTDGQLVGTHRIFTISKEKEELQYVGDVADVMGLGDVDMK